MTPNSNLVWSSRLRKIAIWFKCFNLKFFFCQSETTFVIFETANTLSMSDMSVRIFLCLHERTLWYRWSNSFSPYTSLIIMFDAYWHRFFSPLDWLCSSDCPIIVRFKFLFTIYTLDRQKPFLELSFELVRSCFVNIVLQTMHVPGLMELAWKIFILEFTCCLFILKVTCCLFRQWKHAECYSMAGCFGCCCHSRIPLLCSIGIF